MKQPKIKRGEQEIMARKKLEEETNSATKPRENAERLDLKGSDHVEEESKSALLDVTEGDELAESANVIELTQSAKGLNMLRQNFMS